MRHEAPLPITGSGLPEHEPSLGVVGNHLHEMLKLHTLRADREFVVGSPSLDAALSRIGLHLLQYLHQETDAHWSLSASPVGTAFGVPGNDGSALSFLCLHDDLEPQRFQRLGAAVASALGSIAEAEARSVVVLQDPSDLAPAASGEMDGRMIAYFQPIVDLATGEVVAIEALARIQTADGVLGPDSFLDAYSTGPSMLSLFDRMLDSSLQFLVDFRHRMPDLSAALNLEFAGVPDVGLAELVERRLIETGTDAGAITIELNERIAYQLTDGARVQLRKLVDLGVKLLLDDVPHSFHALDQLGDIPVSGAKLDRRYVQQVNGTDRDVAEVREILARAADAGIEMIAEGVETQSQCDKLVQLGCQFGQGYLFAVPQSCDSLSAVLGARLVGSW
jgi:EAL domain-containing protein (putative c-di-GMP-specific phosphodiesterase class I)